jgi:protein TonB
MSSTPAPNIHLTANDEFKAKYPKYVRWSAVIAVLITLVFFLVTPQYVPNPYKLRRTELEVVDLPPETIELPPPPKDLPPPPKVVEAAPDDEVTEDVEIAETLMELDSFLDTPTTNYDMGGEVGFVASQTPPQLLPGGFAQPEYPEMARISQLEGTVLVKVLVGPDGSVMAAEILQGVHPILNRAALAAARRCKFQPGRQRNIPVKAWMAIPYNFRLH